MFQFLFIQEKKGWKRDLFVERDKKRPAKNLSGQRDAMQK